MQIEFLGQQAYANTLDAMQRYTLERNHQTPDALWVCEHPPIFTLGLSGLPVHVLNAHGVPVVNTNRGGQVTYHGPGQVVVYPLIDLKRAGYFVKEYVFRTEEAVLRTLLILGVTGHRVRGAPGIYVRLDAPASHARLLGADGLALTDDALLNPAPGAERLGKIAALGIKVSRQCTYHGVALNVAMDLTPFSHINPCGYAGLATVDLASLGCAAPPSEVGVLLAEKLASALAP